MTAMVFGRIASMLEKQKGTPSTIFTFIVARQAAQHINSAYLIEPSSKEENSHDSMTLAVISHMTLKDNSGVCVRRIIEF